MVGSFDFSVGIANLPLQLNLINAIMTLRWNAYEVLSICKLRQLIVCDGLICNVTMRA